MKKPKKINLGELFEVSGKLYTIVHPRTPTQTGMCNDHNHIVITLIRLN